MARIGPGLLWKTAHDLHSLSITELGPAAANPIYFLHATLRR